MKTGTQDGWTDISADLIMKTVNGEEVLAPRAVPAEITLGNGGTDHMSLVSDKEGHTIEQSWPFGALPVPTVSGNIATYGQVLPGVDLVQVAGKTGVSQVLKIYTPEAAKDPRVVDMRVYLDSHNAAIASDGQGGLKATGTDSGQVELSSSQGLWWDSKDPSASVLDAGEKALPRPFSLSVSTENGQQVQHFDMASILSTEELTYPLYVDPDWTVERNGFIYVDSGYPTSSYWNGALTIDGTMHVGYLSAAEPKGDRKNHVTRAFYQFNTSSIVGSTILSAVMNTSLTYSYSCNARPVDAWMTGGVGSGTNWNSQPSWLQKVATANVAHGWSPGCPGSQPVGFDMAAVKAGLKTSPQWTVGLRAANEGDSYGWKKFATTAQLIVTKDRAPNIPKMSGITGGSWTGKSGASPYVTRFRNPIFYVDASDPDGDTGGTIKVWLSVFTSAHAVVYSSPSGVQVPGSGGKVSQPSPILADGKYQIQAQSKDQQGLTSAVMIFDFTVDTTAPNPPLVTPITAGFDANHNNPGGIVGESKYDFKISNPGKYPADGYVYSVTSGPPNSAFPTSFTCGLRTKEYVVVCPGTAPATITVAPVSTETTITAWTFDQAGNVGQTIKGAASTYTFTVGVVAPMPSTVLPVALHGGASLVEVETQLGHPVASSCQGGLPADSDVLEKDKVFQFSSPGDYADTVSAAVDTSKSFSISGWFCAAQANSSALRSLMTQQATTDSPGAGLRLSTGGMIQLDTFTGARGAGLESVQNPNSLLANRWYFVSAVYDTANRQLRMTMTTDGLTSTWTIATTSPNHLASDPTQPAILGAGGADGLNQFVGQLYHPVITQGVLTPAQFGNAQSLFNGQTGVLK